MASLTFGLIVLALGIGIPVALLVIPYQFCKGELSFWSFAALPLGSTIPWIVALLLVASVSPLVAEVKQAGYGFTPVILFFGSAVLFVGTAVWGAFHGLDAPSFSARVLLGAKISLFFALAATLWIL